MKGIKRIMSLLLALVLVLGYIPGAISASAAEEDGLCEHHPAHDENCGYVAAREGSPCNHTACDESCLTEAVTECLHQTHDESCGYAEGDDSAECGHICSVENRCVTMVCSHEHNGDCGYVKGEEGKPCAYTVNTCEQCALAQTPAPATDTQTLPMYARITGGDSVNYSDSMTGPSNSTGPWLSFVASKDSSATPFTGFVSSDTNVVDLEVSGGGDGSALRFLYHNTGTATITHTEENTVYTFTVTVTEPEPQTLRYRINDQGVASGGTWIIAPDSTVDVKFYLGTNSMTQVDNGNQRFSLDVAVTQGTDVIQLTKKSADDNSGMYTIKALKEGNAVISYTDSNNATYQLEVCVQIPQYRMIPVQPAGNPNWIDLAGLKSGKPIQLRCYLAELYGPPVGSALTGLKSSDESVFTLELTDAAAGIYTMTPQNTGVAQIEYVAGEKTYSCEVIVIDQNFMAEGLLYYPAVQSFSGKAYAKTVINIAVGQKISKEFYYTEPSAVALAAEGDASLQPLTLNQVTWSGPIKVEQSEGNTELCITGIGQGTGYLEVKDEEGITHCFVVNVGVSAPNTEITEGGYLRLDNGTVIAFGNPGIQSSGDYNAEQGVLKLRAQINSGFDDTWPEDSVYREAMCFAAMKADGTVDKDVMEKVKNVTFSLLAIRNTDETLTPYASLEREECEKIMLTEGGYAWTNYLVAGGKEAFKGLVGMTFDLEDTSEAGETITRRITLCVPAHNTFMGQDVTVTANVETAAQLNVILSSYDALKTWIKAEYPQYQDTIDDACNVNLILPKGDFTDAVVVSETIAPFPFRDSPPSNPNFRVYLRANGETKLAGLISKGSLAGVQNINFVATEGKTMTYGNETFTCGLMADSTWQGTVVYDMDFAKKYDIDPTANKRNLSSWQNDDGMKYVDCDILTVENCSFTGFDYGNRSTKTGYVGGGTGNSFYRCFYGIYFDCLDKKAGFDITYSGFGSYDFQENVVAVRIVSLQNGMTPYEFRIHDSDFINNYVEFWIDKYNTEYVHNYYFYRNFYGGKWEKPGHGHRYWHAFGADTMGNATIAYTSHRGPRYYSGMGNGVTIFVSGSPSRSTPNLARNRSAASEDAYWIYSGEDQVTRIMSDQTLPIAQEALEGLTGDAEVSVVTDDGIDTIAVWTFEGGE